ncbi:MAG: hypothetical protein QXI66_12090 [Pyrobaculum sp.]
MPLEVRPGEVAECVRPFYTTAYGVVGMKTCADTPLTGPAHGLVAMLALPVDALAEIAGV